MPTSEHKGPSRSIWTAGRHMYIALARITGNTRHWVPRRLGCAATVDQRRAVLQSPQGEMLLAMENRLRAVTGA